MKKIFEHIKKSLSGLRSSNEDDFDESDVEEGYVELNSADGKDKKSSILLRPFTLEDFSDVKEILDVLRDGYTIVLINIKPLRDKDLVELKRAINKLKKTVDALQGDIAGFGEDYIAVTPSFAKIYRAKGAEELEDI